jgi:hypothetical protein
MSKLGRAAEWVTHSNIDRVYNAKRHFEYCDRYFKYVSWIAIVAALEYAAKATQNWILWIIFGYSYLRVLLAVLHLITSLPDRKPASEQFIRSLRVKFTLYVASLALSFWLISPQWGLVRVIDSLASARCLK